MYKVIEEKYESDGEQDYVGDCMAYPVLHIIAIEKSFDPQEITNVVVFKEKEEPIRD